MRYEIKPIGDSNYYQDESIHENLCETEAIWLLKGMHDKYVTYKMNLVNFDLEDKSLRQIVTSLNERIDRIWDRLAEENRGDA